MKYIFIICLLFNVCKGQTTAGYINTAYGTASLTNLPIISYGGYTVVSTYDTVVKYNGLDTCHHYFATKDIRSAQRIMESCAVIHGAAGCDRNWLHNDIICTKCLKNMEIIEHRTAKPIKTPEQIAAEKNDSDYKEAMGKLQEIKREAYFKSGAVGMYGISVGRPALSDSSLYKNTAVGGVALGRGALSYNDTINYNIAIGFKSLQNIITGGYSGPFGKVSKNKKPKKKIKMKKQTSFICNPIVPNGTTIGYQSGNKLTTGINNVAIVKEGDIVDGHPFVLPKKK